MTNTLSSCLGKERKGEEVELNSKLLSAWCSEAIVSCRRAFCNGKASSVTSDSEIETVWRPDYTKPLDSLLTINTRIKI